MRISELIEIFRGLNCDGVYAKELSENDNSKQQIYLGPDFQSINQIPKGSIYTDMSGTRQLVTYKADLDLYWLNEQFQPEQARRAKLIWYPKYPEVRLSGFLAGCNASPSSYMQPTNRIQGRVMFFGTDSQNFRVYCYLGIPESELARELRERDWDSIDGVLIDLINRVETDPKSELLTKLKEIHDRGPINGCRMRADGEIVSYQAQNAGGLTLEAMLGIPANSSSEADFLGWEIKQFATTAFDKIRGKKITLFTSEPNIGSYHDDFGRFMETYGKTRPGTSRYDFTGQHIAKFKTPSTGLRMLIEGFDFEKNEILEATGKVVLLDQNDNIAAGWSFASLLDHWERKHENACYVPTLKLDNNQYAFGNHVVLGIETSFLHFVTALNYGIIYYDPGNRVNISNGNLSSEKRRNQFRFSSSFLGGLYRNIEEVNLNEI